MKVHCEGCDARYAIADERIAGRVFRIRCKRCAQVLIVRGAALALEPTRVEPVREAGWHLVDDGGASGPFPVAHVIALLADGRIGPDALVWRDGMDGWRPAREVEALAGVASSEAAGPTLEPAPPAIGTRNDSSVLFSIASLSALARGSRAAPAPAPVDGSGLIDLRALAANATAPEPAPDEPVAIMALAPLRPPLLAPVTARAGGRRLPLLAGLAALGVLLVGLLVAVAVLLARRDGAVARADVASPPEARVPTTAVTTGTRARAPGSVDVQGPRSTTGPVDEEPERDAPTTRREPARRAIDRAPTASPRRAPADVEPTERPAGEAATPARTPPGDRSLERLITAAIDAPPDEPTPPSPPATDRLPEVPPRDAVAVSLRSVSGPVRACGRGERGVLMAQVTIAGATGRVSGVRIGGPLAGSAAATCAEAVIGRARFPRFARPTFSVGFPYSL